MPCYEFQSDSPSGPPWSSGFASEAECLEACKEGACCNGTTCSVKPQCECNAAAGEVFKGVGTVCSPNPCAACQCGETVPQSLTVDFIGGFDDLSSMVLLPMIRRLSDTWPRTISLNSPSFTEIAYEYATLGCSNLQWGEASPTDRSDAMCQSCPPDFYANTPGPDIRLGTYALPSVRVALFCSGRLDRTRTDFISSSGANWEEWQIVWPQGICSQYETRTVVNFTPSPRITGRVPYYVTPLCEGTFEAVEFPAFFSRFTNDPSYVLPPGAFSFNSQGSVRITPNYANPLP